MSIRINPKNKQRLKKKGVSKAGFIERFINNQDKYGAQDFLDAAKKWGRNEKGDLIEFTNCFEELLLLIGDYRLPVVYTSGAAQQGKTLSHTLLVCYLLTEAKLNTLWSYDLDRSLRIQVPSNFRPVVKYWLESKGVYTVDGSRTNELYQVGGCTSQFVYVSTSKKTSRSSGGAAAGGNVVGVSRDWLFKEERSQYPVGSDEPLHRRLDAGRIPSRPVREIGTPGSGSGIEKDMSSADYLFEPHCECPHCGNTVQLNPKGALLKKIQNSEDIRYLSDSGKPVRWFHSDDKNAIKSAYFGCTHCKLEIPQYVRVHESWYQCVKTGITARDFILNLDGIRQTTVGIYLSPLLKESKLNLASQIIKSGINTKNSDDWQQQRLGLPSESLQVSITLQMLRKAIAAQLPQQKPKRVVTILGGDQGRREDWIIITRYHLPAGTPQQSIDNALREVAFSGAVARAEVPRLIDKYKVNFGLYDNEPDRTDISKLCNATCLEMADQKINYKDAVKKDKVHDGGQRFTCWNIDSTKFMNAVLVSYSSGNVILPDSWDKWEGNNSEMSPLIHLQAPKRDPETGKWERPGNHVDDIFFASMFAEAAIYIYCAKSGKAEISHNATFGY